MVERPQCRQLLALCVAVVLSKVCSIGKAYGRERALDDRGGTEIAHPPDRSADKSGVAELGTTIIVVFTYSTCTK